MPKGSDNAPSSGCSALDAGPAERALRDRGPRAIVAVMRALVSGSALLTTCFIASQSVAAPIAERPASPVEQGPPTPSPTPPSSPSPSPSPSPAAPTPSTSEEAPAAPPTGTPTLPSSPEITAPFDDRRPATTLGASAQHTTGPGAPPNRFARNYGALLGIEARFGFNTRLRSRFDSSANEQLLDSTFALGAYVAWSPRYALGIELEHAGLGRVRGLSGQSSLDADYTANSAFLGARFFPWRSDRVDFFVNLRIGLAWQHVDVLGTRQDSSSIIVPPTSFTCSEWDGPGLGLGGAVGAALRLSQRFSVQSRVDATALRLNGDALSSCAGGIGSVATISGTLGLAYDFELAAQ